MSNPLHDTITILYWSHTVGRSTSNETSNETKWDDSTRSEVLELCSYTCAAADKADLCIFIIFAQILHIPLNLSIILGRIQHVYYNRIYFGRSILKIFPI